LSKVLAAVNTKFGDIKKPFPAAILVPEESLLGIIHPMQL
jgi:hypothetical protein